MPNISKELAFGSLTTQVAERLVHKPEIPSLFRNMFSDVVSNAIVYAYDEILTKRNVFEDDTEFGEPEIFKLEKSTEKGFSPPIFHKAIAYNAWDQYNRVSMNSHMIPAQNYKEFKARLVYEMQVIQDALDRTMELWCANAMQTGIVTMKNKTAIDFKPKATHKLAYAAGEDFSINTVDPAITFIKLGDAVVGDGLVDPSVPIKVILGSSVLNAFQNNPFVQKRADIKRYELINLSTGTGSMIGAVPQGSVSYGSYRFDLFTYPAIYTVTATGVDTPIFNPKAMLVMGDGQKNIMFYGGVPDVNSEDATMVASKRMIYTQKELFTRKMGFFTRPVPIMKTINKIAYKVVLT